MKNNKKAFTLIELLTVIIIIGLIMMIVIPSLQRSAISSDQKKFNEYYTMLEEAVLQYATSFKNEELGDATQYGCSRFNYEEVLDSGLITRFKDDRFDCKVEDNTITVRNDNGSYYSEFRMFCVPKKSTYMFRNKTKAFEKGDSNKEVACKKAETIEAKILIDQMVKETKTFSTEFLFSLPGQIGSDIKYITEIHENKSYIYYSGNLWHAYAYDSNEGIRAYNMDAIGVSPFSMDPDVKKYQGSDVQKYLESVYLPTLKDRNLFLALFKSKVNENEIYAPKIALPTKHDFIDKIGPMMERETTGGDTSLHLMNLTDAKKATIGKVGRNYSRVEEVDFSTFAGVVPVISFASTTEVLGGKGTIDNPYIISDNNIWYLPKNISYTSGLKVGEHITLNYRYRSSNLKRTFRVIDNYGKGIKIISLDTYPANPFIEHRYVVQSNLDSRHFDQYMDPKLRSSLYALTLKYNENACKSGIINNGPFGRYNQLNCFDKLNADLEKYITETPFCQETIGTYNADKENRKQLFAPSKLCQYPKEAMTSAYFGGARLGDLYISPARNYGSKAFSPGGVWTVNPNISYKKNTQDTRMWALNNNSVGESALATGNAHDSGNEFSFSEIYGTKIVMTLNPNLKITGGKGTRLEPYTIEGIS